MPRGSLTISQGDSIDIALHWGSIIILTCITSGGVINTATLQLSYLNGNGIIRNINTYGDGIGIGDASKNCNITVVGNTVIRITSVSGSTQLQYRIINVWQ